MQRCELSERGVLELTGPETRAFLQGLITNDIEKLSSQNALYAALLTPQGKYLFDFLIVEAEGDRLWLDCEAARLGDLAKRLTLYKLRAKIEITDRSADLAVWALWGDGDGPLREQRDECRLYADPRNPGLGMRAIGPRAALGELLGGIDEALPSDYHAHRLALGIPESGIDLIPEKTFPLEANMEELNAVDHHKGCYIGQEVTSRTKRKGTLKKRLLPVSLEGEPPQPGTAITAGDSEIGTILSTQGRKSIALIRLDRWREADETGTKLDAGGATVTIDAPNWIPGLS